MNSMNATAVTFAGVNSNSETINRNKSMKNLEILAKNERGKVKRHRKRTSAIDSPSDLLLDSNKDSLLSVAKDDQLRIMVGNSYMMEDLRYVNSNETLRYFFDKKRSFQSALELFNRIHCVYENGIWRSHGSFFECKGPIRVVQRMCTRCRDCDKPKTKTDLYYVDIAEKHRERTVHCHGCMGRILQQNIGMNDARIEKQLVKMRRQQKSGIYIYTRGNN